MYFISIKNFRVRRKESIYFITFTSIVILLSMIVEIEHFAQRIGNIALATCFTALGYIIRPILLFLFILLANMSEKRSRRFYIVCFVPLFINLIIYLFPLMIGVPGISKVVFYYETTVEGTAKFIRGGPLNFFSHIISGFYLVVLIYISSLKFYGKHHKDGFVLLFCVLFIAITVITEVVASRSDLLNIVCEICAVINYIFILSVNSSRDVLTNVYDRRTYYEDISKFERDINGVIQIDMNGLKFLNDTYGHDAGDRALNAVANIFSSSVRKNCMYVYRLSGDEFIILMIDGKKEYLTDSVNEIRKKVAETDYSAALGYYFIDKNSSISVKEAIRKAEELMYIDKNKFYSSTGLERRKE